MFDFITDSTIAYIILIAPVIIILIIVFLNIVNAFKKDSEKKNLSWSFSVLIISLFCSLVGFYFIQQNKRMQTYMDTIKTLIINNDKIVINNNPRIEEVIDLMEQQITVVFEETDINMKYTNAVFAPIKLKRKNKNSYYHPFKAIGYNLQYFIGYPSIEIVKDSREFSTRRSKMQNYLFKLLTMKGSEYFKDDKDIMEIYYVPLFDSFNSWIVSNNKKKFGGALLFNNEWEGYYQIPKFESLYPINHKSTLNYISSKHKNLRRVAKEFIKKELDKKPYYREPFMIFYSNNLERGLSFLTKKELVEKKNKLIATFQYENQTKDLPYCLKELVQIVRKL